MSQDCYFCTETERLEEHHIVPRRFDGSDSDENTVTVCPTCHSKLESLYDSRFYSELGVEPQQNREMPPCEYCGAPSTGQTSFLLAEPAYSVHHCSECAKERGMA